MRLYCPACRRYGHERLDSSCPFRVIFARKRDRLTLRTPATINPDDRDKWRGFAASSAHLGRTVETFVTHAISDGRRGKHAEYTLARQNIEREIKALCAEPPGAFPSSQAGLATVRGAL